MEIEEVLEALRQQQRELERVGEQAEQIAPDVDAFLSKVEKLDDPLQRAEMELFASLSRQTTLLLQQLNAVGQRVVQLEQWVLVLSQEVAQLRGDAE